MSTISKSVAIQNSYFDSNFTDNGLTNLGKSLESLSAINSISLYFSL